MTTVVDLPRRKAETTRDAESASQPTDTIIEAFLPHNFRWGNIDWVVTAFLVSVHVGCIAAPFFFSWTGLIVCVVLHWLTASIGICLGYHRYLSHRSFKLAKPVEAVVLTCGALSGEGSPLRWAATHRLHHQKSDQIGDPHSPLDGPWWSHLFWLFPQRPEDHGEKLYERYVPELLSNSTCQFLERNFGKTLTVAGFGLLGAGWLAGGFFMGMSLLLWGMCVRMTVAYHSTWFVNSATHIWGYRNYETRDHSRNLWWVALLSYGEGWHNNHHAHPSVAPAGHRWWEIDMTWWSIRLLRACGLAWDVKDRIPKAEPKTA